LPSERIVARSLPALTAALPLLLFCSFTSNGQSVSIGTSSSFDENIFDIYLPTSDQITQVQLQVSQDWDFDQSSLTAAYDGAGQFFRDLPGRNYHVHLLLFSALYHFQTDEEEEDSTDEPEETPPDSTGPPSSVRAIRGNIVPPVRSDSADRYLFFSVTGASQFDRDNATPFGNPIVYDNWGFEASASLRQPVGNNVSLRPSYIFSEHTYPNVSALSNIQHIAGLTIGSDFLKGSWIAVTPAYAFKNYTGSSTFTDTVSHRNSSGHGKGFGSGNGGVRVRTFAFASPSVKQFFLSATWKQRIVAGTEATAEYTRYGNPSGEARIIPEQLGGAPGERGAAGTFAADNEIFDDHFAYSGNGVSVQLKQTLPFGITLVARELFQQKTYSSPAMDLADSLTLAPQRDDRRSETDLALSLPLRLGPGKTLTPQVEFHHVRNDSNAPYYVFDKSVFLFGLTFEF
jgi:hypothetical protein